MNKSSSPFFSVIIPCLNEEKYLPRLLRDLSHQTFSNFETIIVDAQSQDQTVTLAKKFTSLSPTIVSSTQKNVSHQRNLGAKKAKSAWLIFFDADTQIPPYFLEGVKYQLSKHSPDLFTCWMQPDSTTQADITITSAINLAQDLLQHTPTPQLTAAMMGSNTLVFRRLHGFNPLLTYGEDSELVIRAVKSKHRFKVFREPQYIFSLRRLKKEGTLNMIRKFSKVQLSRIVNGWPNKPLSDYPMIGGTYYNDIQTKYPLFDLRRFNLQLKKLTLEQKTRLKHLVDYLLDTP